MRHTRRYQAIPVLYRSLECYSDACVYGEKYDPAGEDARRDLNHEYPDLTVLGYVPGGISGSFSIRFSERLRVPCADPHEFHWKAAAVPF